MKVSVKGNAEGTCNRGFPRSFLRWERSASWHHVLQPQHKLKFPLLATYPCVLRVRRHLKQRAVPGALYKPLSSPLIVLLPWPWHSDMVKYLGIHGHNPLLVLDTASVFLWWSRHVINNSRQDRAVGQCNSSVLAFHYVD